MKGIFCRFRRKLYQRANFVTLYFLTSKRLIVFCTRCASCAWDCQCAIYAQDSLTMRNICARFGQDCTYLSNAQYMRKIVLLSSTPNIRTRFAQDCIYFPNAQYMHKICARLYLFLQSTIYGQDLRKIVLLSPMRNICTRFAQDCTYFPNAQYMPKIVLISQCTIYAQDLHKIVLILISPMRNICARFAQDCT